MGEQMELEERDIRNAFSRLLKAEIELIQGSTTVLRIQLILIGQLRSLKSSRREFTPDYQIRKDLNVPRTLLCD